MAWGIEVLGDRNGRGGMPATEKSVKNSLLEMRRWIFGDSL